MTLERIFRFIGLIVFAIVGWQVGIFIRPSSNPFADSRSLQILIPLTLIGAGVGWLVAPWLSLKPASLAIRAVRQIPIEDVVAGAVGLVLGLVIGALLTIPLNQLPDPFGSILPFVASIVFGYLGAMIAVLRGEDILGVFSRFRREQPADADQDVASGPRPVLLDTSVIIDGRIADVAKTGFMAGPLLVPRFVLAELQYIADSPDNLRRARGRRGLEVLDELRGLETPRLEITDMDVPAIREVDEKLVGLAREHGYGIVTNDYNLNRVAVIQGLTVLNLNELANAMKSILLPGEQLRLRVIQEGKEHDQGVGYLDDGTMVVVESGSRHIGREVNLTVTKVLQTSAGRMIFAVPN